MQNTSSSLNHIAIIMDGNRRWARKNLLKASDGHKIGAGRIKDIAKHCLSNLGVRKLSLYAFSSENWNRDKSETQLLQSLLADYLDGGDLQEIISFNIKVCIIGDVSKFEPRVQNGIKKLETQMLETYNKSSPKMQLNIALNYGGRAEITDALNALIASGKQKICQHDITNALQEPQDVDLLIRSGGNKRLSNFLLWQSSYSELYFTDVLWPDFCAKDIDAAVEFFALQKRNFGC